MGVSLKISQSSKPIPIPYDVVKHLADYVTYATYFDENLFNALLSLKIPTISQKLVEVARREDIRPEVADMLWESATYPMRRECLSSTFLSRLSEKQLNDIIDTYDIDEAKLVAELFNFSHKGDLRISDESYKKLVDFLKYNKSYNVRISFLTNSTVPDDLKYNIDECIELNTLPLDYLSTLKVSDICKLDKFDYMTLSEIASRLCYIKRSTVQRKVAEFLINHKDLTFAEDAAERKETPKIILEILANCKHKKVAEIATKQLNSK